MATKRRARLLKVTVQGVFVIDDGDSLAEWTGPPLEVPASHWRDFAKSSFGDDDLEIVLDQYESALPAPEPKPEAQKPRTRTKR